MRKELARHKLAYLVLIGFLGMVGFLFIAAWPDRVYQRYLILVTAFFYFCWGLVTHFKSRRLTGPVVLEYLAVAVLAGAILLLVTF